MRGRAAPPQPGIHRVPPPGLWHSDHSIYIEDITRWREDVNFMFEWQEQYLTSERSERVRYCSCHENIKFISSSQRVMFFDYMETKYS